MWKYENVGSKVVTMHNYIVHRIIEIPLVMRKLEILGTSLTAEAKETFARGTRRGRCGSAVTKVALSFHPTSFLLWFVSAVIAYIKQE